MVASRSLCTVLGTSGTLAAVLAVLACWTPVICVSSTGHACLQDPRPHNESAVWNDSPTGVNVTVLWTVESICASRSECFGGNASTADAIEHQLLPVCIQRGVPLWFQSATYSSKTVKLQYYVTDDVGFKSCDFRHSHLLPALGDSSARLLVSTEYLNNNSNYFIATSRDSPFFDCSSGLRLNATVQDWRCGTDEPTSTSTACSSHGVCAARPWAAYYECYCCDGFSGQFCEIDLCSPEPCLNGGTCIGTSDLPTGFTCHCLPEFTGRLCETKSTLCDGHVCENGGTCIPLNGSVQCACAAGYGGPICSNQNDVKMNVGDDVTTSAQYSVTSGHVTTTAQYPVTSAVAMTTQNADQPQYPASMLTEETWERDERDETESDVRMSLAIVIGLLAITLLILLILFIACYFSRIRRHHGSYYPRSQLQDYEGEYYFASESWAHPVPHGPISHDWYMTSTTNGSSKSDLSASPALSTPGRPSMV